MRLFIRFVTDRNFFDGNIVSAVCHRQTGTALTECFRWEDVVELERSVLRYMTYFHYLNNIDLFTSIDLKEERQDIFAIIRRNLFVYGWIHDNELLLFDFDLTRKYLLFTFSLYVDQSSLFHLRTDPSFTKISLSLSIHVRLKKYSRKSLSSWRFSVSSILIHSKKYLIELCSFLF